MEKLWTRNFVQLSISMLFLFSGFYLLVPALPLYIKEMGGNESQVGIVVGVFTLAAVVLRPVVGGLLDAYGRRPFMLFGLLFFALGMFLYDWMAGMAALIVLRIMHGLSWAVSTTAVGTAITDIIPVSRRGEGMGWYGMAMTLAMAIGPLAGIWMIENQSFQALFWLATGLSVIALLLIFTSKNTDPARIPFRRGGLFEKSVLPITAALFFLAVSYGGIVTFIPLFAVSLDVNAGSFFLVYAITLTLIRPFAGKLADKLGETIVIIPALFICVAALIVLSLSTGTLGILGAAALFGIGFGSCQPALQAATLRLAPPERKGVANASFFTAFDLGIGFGSIGLGWISQYASYPALFIGGAVSVVICLLIFVIAVRGPLTRSEKATA